MKRFWKYQVRYRLARRLIHAGLWVMPPGRYKDDLLGCLWALYDKVMSETLMQQEPLGEEFKQVLEKHRWDLYAR